MGKRSDFERIERDFYPTPYEAIIPLLTHLEPNLHFIEPCAGNGALIDHLESNNHRCIDKFDIEPQREDINCRDVFTYSNMQEIVPFYFITNPPWDRNILHPLIHHLIKFAPTWLLFDADWVHTKQSSELIKYCHKIVRDRRSLARR